MAFLEMSSRAPAAQPPATQLPAAQPRNRSIRPTNAPLVPPVASVAVSDVANVSLQAARAAAVAASGALPDSVDVPIEQGLSHICSWPGCGRGFSSRWKLEAHQTRHFRANGPAEAGPDDSSTYIERRLREKVKTAEASLKRTREHISTTTRDLAEAGAELRGLEVSVTAYEQQLRALACTNQQLALQLAHAAPSDLIAVAERLSKMHHNGCIVTPHAVQDLAAGEGMPRAVVRRVSE